MIDAIEALGRKIESLWEGGKITAKNFSQVALEQLEQANLHRHFDLNQFLEWLIHSRELPKQFSLVNNFGQPPITLYQGKNFFIDIYFWASPEIGIHSHGFDGAFTVLRGRSFHCHYTFSVKEQIGERALFGDLLLKEASWLDPGAVKEIRSGPDFIHQVWHISFPTVSLAVRTPGIKTKGVSQYAYLRPHFAVPSHFLLEPVRIKQLAALLMLRRTHNPLEETCLQRMVSESAPDDALILLHSYFESTADLSLINRAARQAPKIQKWLPPLLSHFKRNLDTQCDWGSVQNEGERFLLALLHSLTDRDQILAFVRDYLSPGSSEKKAIIRWLRSLMGQHQLGFKLNETALDIFSWRLLGYEEKRIQQRLLRKYAVDDEDAVLKDIRRITRRLKSHHLLKVLIPRNGRHAGRFAGSPLAGNSTLT